MSYTINLILSMFEEFAPINEYTKAMNAIIRHLRMSKMCGVFNFKEIETLVNDIDLPIICPRCGHKKKIDGKVILKILSGVYRCIRCYKKVNTGKYIFDWDNIDIVDSKEQN